MMPAGSWVDVWAEDPMPIETTPITARRVYFRPPKAVAPAYVDPARVARPFNPNKHPISGALHFLKTQRAERYAK